MVIVDRLLRDVNHLSSIFAPIMIVVTFFQTLALLLDLNITWPAHLRAWLSRFNVLNINLELARPECSGTFGAYDKLLLTLVLPLFLLVCLAVYALLKYALSTRVSAEEFKRTHGGRGILDELSQNVLTVTSTAYVFGSIFFLRRVLATWVCTTEETVGGPTYLVVEPDIECSDNERYNTLHYMSLLGLLVYLALFGSFVAALYFKRDLFEFLGDKFEDQFYFWELVLVTRKVLVMASFVMFSGMTEQAWFMGSAVMVASLILHAATKPYEDKLIDWCEFLSLVSTLFIFQSGVLFKVLNDPANPQTGERARSLSAGLETASIILLFLNVLLGVYIQTRVWSHVTTGDEDYRVRLMTTQRVALALEMEAMDAGIDKAAARAAAKAEERASRKKAAESVDDVLDSIEEKDKEFVETENPLTEK